MRSLRADPQRFNSVIVGGAGLHPFRQSDAIITALEADDPSTISDPTALGFRNFARAQSQNDLKALAAVQMSQHRILGRESTECVARAPSSSLPAPLHLVETKRHCVPTLSSA